MRLPIPCMQCFQEFGKPTEEFSHVEFRCDARYAIQCSFGHETIDILQQQKFKVFFEINAHTIIDGYYREAMLCRPSHLA